MQLLIIPAVIAVAGFVINLTVSNNEQRSTKLRDQTEREIALDNQREAALQIYIDKMAELLLEKQLRESKSKDEVRKIARVRTLTVLRQLNAERKGIIFRFLSETGLILFHTKGEDVINLKGADFSDIDASQSFLMEANLDEVNLSNSNLSEALLFDARLQKANLYRVNLTKADLANADFTGANLGRANLSQANSSSEDIRPDFCKVNFSYSKIVEADLSRAIFSESNFQAADLRKANLSRTELIRAKLSFAKLNGANLEGANLEGANLFSAYLEGANLRGAKVTSEQLKQVSSLQGTIMPDGSIHP